MKWDYRNLKYSTIAISILWTIATGITIFKLLTIKSLSEALVSCLMFVAMIIMLIYLIIWWEHRP